jgi:hypothetical protein
MKVSINHTEKSVGMIRKTKHYGVTVMVTFDATESAIITERRLEKDIVIERGYPSDMSHGAVEKHANRGLGKKLLTAAISGLDANDYNLTVNKLTRGDTYHFSTPVEAKEYEAQLKEALVTLKGWILGNESVEQKSDSFEI